MKELIDETFYVQQSRWKTWKSTDLDGNQIITSFTRESCISATRFYLKGKQEGFPETKTYLGEVGGKL